MLLPKQQTDLFLTKKQTKTITNYYQEGGNDSMSGQKKNGLTLQQKHGLTGWVFLAPAVLLICWTSFYPMIRAFILSLQTGMGVNLNFTGFTNYTRILKDPTFKQTLFNTFFYLIIQVPIMLVLALILASLLNNKQLRFKGLFRTCIFLPCATSLVSYAMIFRYQHALSIQRKTAVLH